PTAGRSRSCGLRRPTRATRTRAPCGSWTPPPAPCADSPAGRRARGHRCSHRTARASPTRSRATATPQTSTRWTSLRRAVERGASDGLRANGVLTLPPDFSPGRRYPLVLLIHGGPTASSTEEFSARAQLLAAHGWLVFQPNYRGSDNLGNAFQRAIAASAAEGPGRDIMAGVAALVRRGIVDTTRLAVTGWSYGGYLTAWLLGRYAA